MNPNGIYISPRALLHHFDRHIVIPHTHTHTYPLAHTNSWAKTPTQFSSQWLWAITIISTTILSLATHKNIRAKIKKLLTQNPQSSVFVLWFSFVASPFHCCWCCWSVCVCSVWREVGIFFFIDNWLRYYICFENGCRFSQSWNFYYYCDWRLVRVKSPQWGLGWGSCGDYWWLLRHCCLSSSPSEPTSMLEEKLRLQTATSIKLKQVKHVELSNKPQYQSNA